jgi:hypothetical protein
LLSRANRFQTMFQWPYSLGSARQRTFSTVKKCSASRNRRQKPPAVRRLAPPARQTRPEHQQCVFPVFLARPCR